MITENNGKYDVRVTVFGDASDEWKNVSIAPLYRKVFIGFRSEMIFTGMEVRQLTEFYRIRIRGRAEEITRIVMIPTSGFPENRETTGHGASPVSSSPMRLPAACGDGRLRPAAAEVRPI